MKMIDPVVDFIYRRFSIDCNWTTGNCYYFALILHDRFKTGTIFYDVINGHFIYFYNGKYYDWTGDINPDGKLVEWNKFDEYDSTLKQRIIKDCLL